MNGLTRPALFAALAVTVVLLIACLQANAAECYPIQIARVIDSDSYVSTTGERIRVAGLDGPEIGSRAACPREAQLGQIATTDARRRLGSASSVTYCPTGRESWGRTEAHVYVDGQNLADAIILDGWAVEWTGKKHDWCAVP